MPLLLYCVAPETAEKVSVTGVEGEAVNSAVFGDLRFFFSHVKDVPADTVAAAQQLHRIVQEVFSHSAVLPFRYPTILKEEAELQRLAAEKGAAFGEFLQRVAGKAQIDVRLTLEVAEPGPANTGRAYLEARARSQALLSAAAETCRQTALSADWKIRPGDKNIRCQVLVSRVEVLSFLTRMRALELPEGVQAAVSGPWPPTGFWEDDSR